ncbi:hypothetical protein BHM03_00029911 [Ensete ventricosum]|nr:hypothetical protein BHM03_00029911 [Ensete ventricosum]
MHPLKFPNSGIRAKVFVRKIGFKLRVMRLNRVESFYVFLLHFRSEGNEEEGRPTTASPMQDRQPTARPQLRPPARGGVRLRSRPARKGGQRMPTRSCRPRPTLPPVGEATPAAGVAVPWQSDYRWARAAVPWQSDCRWARAVAACAGAATTA